MTDYCIVGCGDIGRRIVTKLIANGVAPTMISAVTRSTKTAVAAQALGISVSACDFDSEFELPKPLAARKWVYLVPPPKEGLFDRRTDRLLHALSQHSCVPESVILISTTGVYGDTNGAWVDETTPPRPQTDRGKRRLDMEHRWQAWAGEHRVAIRVLRVPGIYANGRIPLERLKKAVPVVKAEECGFTNRIHADDLANAVIAATRYDGQEVIFNVTDGTPGTISDYLQSASKVVGLPPLPEITMTEAKQRLSPGMLSYLSESRRIGNEKMRRELKVELYYPDFRVGLRY